MQLTYYTRQLWALVLYSGAAAALASYIVVLAERQEERMPGDETLSLRMRTFTYDAALAQPERERERIGETPASSYIYI